MTAQPSTDTDLITSQMKKLFAVSFLSLVLVAQSFAAAVSVTAASVVPSTQAIYLAGDHYAAVTITSGQVVYVDSSVANPTAATPDIKLASASGTGDAKKVIGFAVSGGSAGQPVKVVIRDPDLTVGGTVAAGDVVYLHTAAGSITTTYGDIGTGQFVCVLGVGTGSNHMNFGATQHASNFIGVIRADVAK